VENGKSRPDHDSDIIANLNQTYRICQHREIYVSVHRISANDIDPVCEDLNTREEDCRQIQTTTQNHIPLSPLGWNGIGEGYDEMNSECDRHCPKRAYFQPEKGSIVCGCLPEEEFTKRPTGSCKRQHQKESMNRRRWFLGKDIDPKRIGDDCREKTAPDKNRSD
jgi:hypothetical protein